MAVRRACLDAVRLAYSSTDDHTTSKCNCADTRNTRSSSYNYTTATGQSEGGEVLPMLGVAAAWVKERTNGNVRCFEQDERTMCAAEEKECWCKDWAGE